MTRRATLIAAFAFTLAAADAAIACKYNVRDVGFVDIGARPFVLRLHPREFSTLDYAAEVSAALDDTNVRPEIIGLGDPDTQATLVHPDGRRLAVPVGPHADASLKPSLLAVVSSPLRDRLRTMLVERHSVVLVVHGSDASANEAADRAAAVAAAAIERSLSDLPKSIRSGPVVISLTPDQQPAERVLLWSLNAEPGAAEARVVVLFGRLRSLGPPLTVPPTDTVTLIERMSFVGADCECELDRSWMTGDMMPHVWNAADESEAARSLGFDPGSPLVVNEVRQILDRGPSTTRRLDRIGVTRAVDPLLGYTETEVTPTPPQSPPLATPEPATTDRAAAPAVKSEAIDERLDPPWLWITLGVAVAACTAGGLLILARSRSHG